MYAFNSAAIFYPGHPYIESTTVLSDRYVVPLQGLKSIVQALLGHDQVVYIERLQPYSVTNISTSYLCPLCVGGVISIVRCVYLSIRLYR